MNPDAIVYDPATKRVFTMNGRSGDITAIDAASGNVVGTIPVGGKLEFAVADGAGHLYVNVETRARIVQIRFEESWSSSRTGRSILARDPRAWRLTRRTTASSPVATTR